MYIMSTPQLFLRPNSPASLPDSAYLRSIRLAARLILLPVLRHNWHGLVRARQDYIPSLSG
jgi:hypothetical protein